MARWNFEDILDKLMPLLEAKLAFTQQMSERAMSLEEKKEANKTDIEYRRLEAKITEDKDQRIWEKEKLLTTIKGNYDLKLMEDKGLTTRASAGFASAKELQEANLTAQQGIKGDEIKQKYYDTNVKGMTDALKEGRDIATTTYNAEGLKTGTTTQAGNPFANKIASDLADKAGIRSMSPSAGKAPDALEDVRNSYRYIEGLRKGPGGDAAAQAAANLLSPDLKQGVAAYTDTIAGGTSPAATLSPQGATPAVPIAPLAATPAVPVRPLVGAAPVAPVAQVAAQPAPGAIAAQALVPEAKVPLALDPSAGKRFAAAGPLDTSGKTAFGGMPGGVAGEIWSRGAIQAAKNLKKRDEEEAKTRLGGVFSR